LSEATELGQHLVNKSLFVRNVEVVTLDGTELRTVTAQTFRTLVEHYVVCYRKQRVNGPSFDVNVTMREDEARGIMASPQFKGKLRCLSRVNLCRLPFHRLVAETDPCKL
jgi:hypothetical protein